MNAIPLNRWFDSAVLVVPFSSFLHIQVSEELGGLMESRSSAEAKQETNEQTDL
jgi:hypothetical protein